MYELDSDARVKLRGGEDVPGWNVGDKPVAKDCKPCASRERRYTFETNKTTTEIIFALTSLVP